MLGVTLLGTIAGVDHQVRIPLLEFSVFYLIPVSFFTWFAGRRWAVLVALGSGAWVLHTNMHEMPAPIAYWNTTILLALYLGSIVILGELRALYLRERDLSRIDPLTTLPNRRAFFEVAEIETSRARRYQHPLTLVYLDVDEFKLINDRFGHIVGDQVLRRVAMAAQTCLRRSDLAARMGGDEFTILLPETSQEAAEPILRRIQAGLRGIMEREGWPVTFSIGAVTFRTPPADVDEMIRIADEEMYRAKGEGKNQLRQKEIA